MNRTWGEAFNAARQRGNHIDSAAIIADNWESRQKPTESPQIAEDSRTCSDTRKVEIDDESRGSGDERRGSEK